jgi:hypothetical protein
LLQQRRRRQALKIIDINIDDAEVVRRRKRRETAMALGRPDRVPVLHCLGARFRLPLIGMGKGFQRIP